MSRLSRTLLAVCLLAGCGNNAPDPASVQSEPASADNSQGVVQTAGIETGGGVVPAGGTASAKTQITYDQALVLADQLIQKRDYNNAARVLTGAIKVQPTSAEAYIKRAAILAESKLHTQAIADISNAIRIQPDNAKLYNTRGYFHLLQEKLDLAEKDFHESIAKDAKYPQPHNNLGLAHLSRKQYTEAVAEFDAALALDPQYVDALNNKGFALLQQDQTDASIAVFSQALQLKPDYINAINNRGRALQKSQRYEEAVADFTQAIELQPGNLQYRLHRAEAYKAWGKEAESAADVQFVSWTQQQVEYNRLIAANPKNSDLWVGYGRHLAANQKFEDAQKCYDQALTLKPGHPQAHLARGLLFMSQSRHDAAIKEFTQALLAEPILEAYSLRGECHQQTGNLDAAIADYEQAKRIDSQVVSAYESRSKLHADAGRAELSSADTNRVHELNAAIAERESAAKDGSAPRAALTPEQAAATEDAQPQ